IYHQPHKILLIILRFRHDLNPLFGSQKVYAVTMTKQTILSLSLISIFFIQCVHREKETDPSLQPVVEMPEFPPIEDPEPSLEVPSHREMFAANLSLNPLKEM